MLSQNRVAIPSGKFRTFRTFRTCASFQESTLIIGRKQQICLSIRSEEFFFREHHSFEIRDRFKVKIFSFLIFVLDSETNLFCSLLQKLFLLVRLCLSGIPPIQIWQPYPKTIFFVIDKLKTKQVVDMVFNSAF